MSNPIFDSSFGNFNQQNANSLSEMLGQIKQAPNPEQALLNMFSQTQLNLRYPVSNHLEHVCLSESYMFVESQAA